MALTHFTQAIPPAQGLYDPAAERDACGVAWVADLSGTASHNIIDKALLALTNLEHRGASGSEPDSGDGAGILTQIPDDFLRAVVDFELPALGSYGVGIAFMPTDQGAFEAAQTHISEIAREENLEVLGWRDLPINASTIGKTARSVMPRFVQVFIASKLPGISDLSLERRLFVVRKRAEHQSAVYFPSLS